MELNGQQRKSLREAILLAYPNKEELQMLLAEEMDIQFEAIAIGGDYNTQVFKLIEKFIAEGNLEQFVLALKENRPHNSIFREFSPQRVDLTPEALVIADTSTSQDPFYIPSVYEERCYQEVKKSGSLIRIKSP